MTYTQIIEQLAVYLWLIDFLILLAVLWYWRVDNEFSSTLITLLVATVISGVMVAYTPDLKAFIRANYPPEGDPSLFEIGLFGWYIGFTLFYFLAMVATWKIHVWFNIKYSVVTYAHLLAYFLLSTLQLTRYSARIGIAPDTLKEFYQIGVLSINIGVSLTALVVVVGVTISRYLAQHGKRGLSWSL